jgi:hypothetical protein
VKKAANSSPPQSSNSAAHVNYQQPVVMYGYRQDQFGFHPGYMPADYMMQQMQGVQPMQQMQGVQPMQQMQGVQPMQQMQGVQPMQQMQGVQQMPGMAPGMAPQWVPVMNPHQANFQYQQRQPDIEPTVQPLAPRPPESSPPTRVAKSPRKISEISSSTGLESLEPIPGAALESPKAIQLSEQSTTSAASPPDTVQTIDSILQQLAPQVSCPSSPPNEDVKPVEMAISAILPSIAQTVANSVPPVISQEAEVQRLSALHSLGILDAEEHPRLNKITQMTARLLGRSCCILSLVDSDKVIWKSVTCSAPGLNIVKEEARYESYCSWVVQDDTGRGVTILDAKTDPRCTHIRAKPGLEFYAGVPVFLGGKFKVGSLNIQGPASAQFSVIDMNILHEMSLWASGELDTIIQQKALEQRDILLQARDKLSLYCHTARTQEKEPDSRLLEKSLGVVRGALRAHCVLLLKLGPDPKGFQSILQAYALSHTGTKGSTLPLGEEMFKELCSLTLKKENSDPLLLDSLKTGAVTKDVDHYLNKKINKCVSELLWSPSGPTAVLAAFFEGNYRTISLDELEFTKNIIPTMSSILDHLELKESFQQASGLFKIISPSLKKNAVQFGKQTGLAPCCMIIEARIPTVKGYEKLGSMFNISSLDDACIEERLKAANLQSEPKGQAQAQQLAQKDPTGPLESKPSFTKTEISPLECFEVAQDFAQILDNLADRFGVKRPKRFGQQYFVFSNYGPETGTYDGVASMAHELFFSLDTYNQNKRKSIKVTSLINV